MLRTGSLVALTSALLLVSQVVFGQAVRATGSAPADPSHPEQSRRQAVQDALQQASLRMGAHIRASERSDQPGSETGRITPQNEPSQYKVVREWSDKQIYYVEIEAEFSTGDDCAKSSARKYRKTLATTFFPTANPNHFSDIDNISDGIPRELMRRLESSKEVLPVATLRANPFTQPAATFRAEADPDTIRKIAEQSNAQFIAVGRVVDGGITAYRTNLWAGLRREPSQRRFELEILLYDGATGVLLDRHSANELAGGKVEVGLGIPFGSQGFFDNDFGRIVGQVLDQQAHHVDHTLGCLPFTARVVKLESGKIYLDAGGTQRLRPGDTLSVFRRQAGSAVDTPELNQRLGIPETPLASISITQVQPRFAIAEMKNAPAGAKIQIGDWVRFDEKERD